MGSAELLLAIAAALMLLMSGGFLAYVALILFHFSKKKSHAMGNASEYQWHMFIPCRDEEPVIGNTLLYLRDRFPRAHFWVIDDASSDQSVEVIRQQAREDPHVHLIQRRIPEARTGKGDALNAGYRALCQWLPAHTNREKVIVMVVDADGLPSSNLLDLCGGPDLFANPRIAAVQVEVRMVNRNDEFPLSRQSSSANSLARLLVRLQDIEFRCPISATQVLRRKVGTVAMGGNGQLTRLAALDTIATDRGPWKGSLLEDFEIGLHLLFAGYQTEYTTDAWIDQEGLPSLRAFLRQRSRWSQGVMQCMRYLKIVWASPHFTTRGCIEVSYYLLQPWLFILGTFLYPIPILLFARASSFGPQGPLYAIVHDGWWLFLAFFFLIGILPFMSWPIIYIRRHERTFGLMQGLRWGFAYSAYVYSFYVTAWWALWRLARHQNDWLKTQRLTELPHDLIDLRLPPPLPTPESLTPVGASTTRASTGDWLHPENDFRRRTLASVLRQK